MKTISDVKFYQLLAEGKIEFCSSGKATLSAICEYEGHVKYFFGRKKGEVVNTSAHLSIQLPDVEDIIDVDD